MATTKKTLLIFVPTFPVRSETFIQREITALSNVAQNFQVKVLSLRPGVEDQKSSPGVDVLYRRISPFDMFFGLFVVSWSLFPKLLSYGLANKQRSLFGNLYILIKAIGYSHVIHALNVSHIHAHFLSESSTLMFYVSEFLNLPFSISAHARDVFATSTDITALPEMIKPKASKASFIVVCNKKAWEKCKELAGVEYEDKILLHYHGLDPSVLPVKTSSNQPSRVFNLVSVGRLVEKKGYTYLIDAVKVLRDQNVQCHINIIGPGPLYTELTEKINATQVGDSIQVLGGGQGMPNDEVLKYMSEADGFVLPSIETAEGDAEGIPNTLVEAAFLKLPIISTKSGSIQEFIHDGTSGILVEPKDVTGLANAIKDLVNNPENAQIMGENAWKSANSSFNLPKNIIELNNLFSENLA